MVREPVPTVQRDPSEHPWVLGRVLAAEVDPFLAIGHTGGQFAAEWEPTTPCGAGPRHRDRLLLGIGECEERMRRRLEALLKLGGDAVPDDREEPNRAARIVDGFGDSSELIRVRCGVEQWRDVDQGHGVAGGWCRVHSVARYRCARAVCCAVASPNMQRRLIASGVLMVVVVLGMLLGGWAWLTEDGNVEDLLTDTGVVGPIIFVFVMWLTQPWGVPGFVYMVPAGIVWPYPLAIALAWIGNMGASYLAFIFARWFAKDWVQARIPAGMHRYDRQLAEGGVWPVVILRLVFGQLPPADWLLGVSKVSTKNFLIGTGIGIIPGVVLFVVAGGGMYEYLTEMSATTRWILIGAVSVLVVLRRARLRLRLRLRRAASVTQ